MCCCDEDPTFVPVTSRLLWSRRAGLLRGQEKLGCREAPEQNSGKQAGLLVEEISSVSCGEERIQAEDREP